MRIIGLNVTKTSTGISLYDGSAVLLEDGIITIAIAEERINRIKYSGGIKNALRYILEYRGLTLKDIDYFVFSNCADLPLTKLEVIKFLDSEGLSSIDQGKILICPSHHLSHAASCFFASPFEEALIFVADNEGNVIGEKKYEKYWLNRLERSSVFVGIGNKIELVARFNDNENELSIGAAYNYFTKWLGFKTYHDAGKTMALAAFGKGLFKNVKVFSFSSKNERLNCYLKQNHENKPFSVRELFLKNGIDIGYKREDCFSPDALQKEVAWVIQKETEKAILSILKHFIVKTGIKNICLAGGVALNCVINMKIVENLDISGLFIQPAAGDIGQAIGNALWAYHIHLKKPRKYIMRNCFLGKIYNEQDIIKSLNRFKEKIIFEKIGNIEEVAAELVASGQILGWFQGRSEFGPRALGNRSIIGDPRRVDTKRKLDEKVKKREPFRPYAPSILEEYVTDWFELSEETVKKIFFPLKFMIIAPKVKKNKRDIIPAVVHIDGSSRVQIVSSQENPKFYRLIHKFFEITGVPLVLNTSFNLAGEPIVETPNDAILSFLKMGLDALIIENFLIRKRGGDHA